MRRATFILFIFVFVAGCQSTPNVPLSQARRGFVTKLSTSSEGTAPTVPPPASGLRLVSYSSHGSTLPAYLSNVSQDGVKRPGIVWITGGDCNTIDEGVWQDAPPDNDQTARAFRQAGIVTLYPSLRGGNANTNAKEAFYGETDDVAAAAQFLASQPGVDPQRIYLGGHSTGGTLALLAAECHPKQFRAVFSFGPVDDVSGYGGEIFPQLGNADQKEIQLRSPGYWLSFIGSPTFVFEGEDSPNVDCLRIMERESKSMHTRFYVVSGRDHFNILAPLTRLITRKILQDTSPQVNIVFTKTDIDQAR